MKPFPRKQRKRTFPPKMKVDRKLSKKQIAYYQKLGFKVLRHPISANLILFNPKTGKEIWVLEEHSGFSRAMLRRIFLPEDELD